MNPHDTTIRELIERLEELAAEQGDDTPVRLAQQPRWAFEYTVGDIVRSRDGREPVIYIGEGQQVGYLPGRATRALGWGK